MKTDTGLWYDSFADALSDLAYHEQQAAGAGSPQAGAESLGQLSLRVFDFLYLELAPHVVAFYSDRAAFAHLEKELNQFLRLLSFDSILEHGDDRIYTEVLARSRKRAIDRTSEVSAALTAIANVMSAQPQLRELLAWVATKQDRPRLLMDGPAGAGDHLTVSQRGLLADISNLPEADRRRLVAIAETIRFMPDPGDATRQIPDFGELLPGDKSYLTDVAALLTDRKRARLSALLDQHAQTALPTQLQARKGAQKALEGAHDEQTAAQQIRMFIVERSDRARQVNRILATLTSANIETVLSAELEPMRMRGAEIHASPLRVNLTPLVTAAIVGLVAAGAAYAMSVIPWWRPFAPWILLAPVGVFIVTRSIRRMLDASIVDDIREGFARVLFGARRRSFLKHRFTIGSRLTPEERIYKALRERRFMSSVREYWECQPPLSTRPQPVGGGTAKAGLFPITSKSLEGAFLRYLGRDPFDRLGRAMRGLGSRSGILRDSLTPVAAGVIGALLYSLLFFGLVSGRWPFPLFAGEAAFYESFPPRMATLTAAITADGPLGGECLLTVGHIVWDGERINVRPLPGADGGAGGDRLQVIERSIVRRIIYQRDDDAGPGMPPEAAHLPDCRLSYAAPGARDEADVQSAGGDDARGEPLAFSRRTVLLPFFSQRPAPGSAQDVFDRSARRSAVAAEMRPYMETLAQALHHCATAGPVVMDVVGFASDKRLGSSDAYDNDALNWALAEGRRRYVLSLLDRNNARLLVRPAGSHAEPRPVGELLSEKSWSTFAKRFDSFAAMAAHRSRIARAAVPDGNAIEELLARAVIIQFESLGDCDTPGSSPA